ncbi:MAG: TIGR02921 family PEP-CTERM protein [Phormidesmis sp.]
MKKIIAALSHLVFWTWNLVFIGIVDLWLLPEFGLDLLLDTRTGLVEPTFTLSMLILLLVPPICTILGFWRLRNRPTALLRLFYGVEAPLFTLCLLRLFLLRELTPATAFALGLVVFSIFMFAIELLAGYAAHNEKLSWVQMVGHSLILLIGGYAGCLLLLYTVPALVWTVVGFFRWLGYLFTEGSFSDFFSGLWFMLTHPIDGLLGLAFSFLSISGLLVFISMPYAFVHFYVQAWERIYHAFSRQHGVQNSWKITGVSVAISCALFVGLQLTQPQVKAFEILAPNLAVAEPSLEPSLQLPAAALQVRQSQLQDAKTIRSGLTNAYLYRYRYLSPWSQSNALGDLYRPALPVVACDFLQTIHNGLLSPFLYRGQDEDVQQAAELYEQFFDEPIQKAERAAIREALQATADRDETKAGLLDLDKKIVRLASQDVTVKPHGDWATVEIHERYENSTPEDQEIFYSFSLPESAAITGLWLGNEENPRLFPHVVSPRGAAQQVYNNEVERAKFQQATDPALLEQVGPRQYRLRVFPIPRSTEIEDTRAVRDPGELDLTMTYDVMAQADGDQTVGWPLPQLSEKRNIFWTAKTEHLRGDRTVQLSEDDWFEPAIPAQNKLSHSSPDSLLPQTHHIDFAEGYRVTAAPLTDHEKQLPTDQRIAVVVDSSYSMRQQKAALAQAAAQLKPATKQNTLDFYIAVAGQSKASVQRNLAVDALMFYGTLQPADMLTQFAQQQGEQTGEKPYDAVLLLTDEGSYELAEDQAALPALSAPLWIVHLGGTVPSAYEDNLLQMLEASRGGVDTDVMSVLQKIAAANEDETVLDGYSWQVDSPSEGEREELSPKDAEFMALAARQLIRQQGRVLDTTQVAALDAVHAIAKRTSIVTPYSSMLVLVDERQRELLRAAEAGEDRFEREVEDGQNDLTNPGNALTTSVPEPGQVVGIVIMAIALITLKRKSVRLRSPQI